MTADWEKRLADAKSDAAAASGDEAVAKATQVEDEWRQKVKDMETRYADERSEFKKQIEALETDVREQKQLAAGNVSPTQLRGDWEAALEKKLRTEFAETEKKLREQSEFEL